MFAASVLVRGRWPRTHTKTRKILLPKNSTKIRIIAIAPHSPIVRGMADDLFARYGDSDSEESARDDS